MTYLKKQRQNKTFRITVWTIITALVSYGIAELSKLNYGRVPVMTLVIREIMKYVNVVYFGDIGVDQENKS